MRSRVLVLAVVLAGLTPVAIGFTYDSPARAESFWVLGQLVVLVIAAWYAAAQVAEARELRRDQARPFVVVDLDPWSREQLFMITIENLGKTIARDVRISFDPPLKSTMDHEVRDGPRADLAIWRDGIPSLAPGKRLYVILDLVHRALGADEIPKRYSVTVTYSGPHDEPFPPERFVLDLDMYRGLAVKIRDRD